MVDEELIHSKIAIVGMSCRVPDGDTPSAFWQNIVRGVESIRTFRDEELQQAGVPAELLNDPHYVKRGAVLKDTAYFDAGFFRYTAKDAEITDPQHRVFLECAWEALEDAGCVQDLERRVVGVYASSCLSSYVLRLYEDQALVQRLGHVQIGIGNEKDFLASKVSFKLGLRGPSVNVQTACSSSLVAVHLASQSLLNGECDIALAGGVTIRSEQTAGYVYQIEGMVSPDGHCRVFAADSAGTVFGNGIGIVVLKRLADAISDRDNIQAVICGTAVNNDGEEKIGYTAPSPIGQAQVIHEALTVANVSPREISYIETHGTGTELGDAIEIKALKEVFQTEAAGPQFCAIGSVKPNIGHLDTAAGIIGLIKTALALKHQVIPPCIRHEQPNPKLAFEQSPFYVNTRPRAWKDVSDSPKAGVSSFGIGGTNAHVVLEEAPTYASDASARQHHLFLVSAKTEKALANTCRKMAQFFRTQPALSLADVSFTLQTGRAHFPYRKMAVCSSLGEAARLLEAAETATASSSGQEELRAAFWFSPQTQALGRMGRELYQTEPRFARIVDGYIHSLSKEMPDMPSLERLLPGAERAQGDDALDPLPVELSQFFCQSALADFLVSLGIKPQVAMADGAGLFSAVYQTKLATMRDLAKIIVLKQQWLRAAEEQQGRIEAELASLLRTMPVGSAEYDILASGLLVTSEQVRQPHFWLRTTQTSALPAATPPIESDVHLVIGIGMKQPNRPESPLPVIHLLPVHDSAESAEWRFASSLGEIWLQGAAMDWKQRYLGENRNRLSLPTYGFDRDKYWFAKTERTDQPQHNLFCKNEVEKWLYRPVWKQYSGSGRTRTEGEQPETYLLFSDANGSAEGVKHALQAKGKRVCTVQAGQQFSRLAPDRYEVHPEEPEQYLTLLREVFQPGQTWKLVHMWSFSAACTDAFPTGESPGFFHLLHLGKAFGMLDPAQSVQLFVVAPASQSITGNEALAPEHATVLGAVQVIPQEFGHVRSAFLEMEAEPFEKQEQLSIKLLVEELLTQEPEKMLAIRNRHKWVRTFEPLRLDSPEAAQPGKGGVHLVLGGLGGIGLTAARALTQQGAAAIVLTGRSPFLPETQWAAYVATTPASDPLHQKIRELMQMKASGAQLRLYQVDVSDEAQMKALLEEVEATVGRIDGIVFSAGRVVSDFFQHAIPHIRRDMCEAEFAVKQKGLLILEKLIREKEIGYCLVNSSLSSILGGIGLVAYTAANQFMDSFVQKMNQVQQRTRWMSVGWDAWNFSLADPASRTAGSERLEQLISPAEGRQLFAQLFSLLHEEEHVIVSTTDLEPRLEQWLNRPRYKAEEGQKQNRREIPLEQLLQETIQEAIGQTSMGLDDNFFDAGITSLDMVGINDILQKTIQKPVLISSWFEYPTIRKLAGYLQAEDSEKATTDRGFDRSEIVHKGMDKLKLLRQKGKEVRNG
ncbi:type I polyketide synthase [Brevibacillus agri]|uniref:type I polyketide synthase n=1 Tax=Brevibacillus agri TaxID=51101 RepID=UPI00046EF166|nr:SDR family NAD(P)-dependent oxidoreductase [Brevibacillus agri]